MLLGNCEISNVCTPATSGFATSLVHSYYKTTDGYVTLVKELNWKRVAVIAYDDAFNINV